jgi:hypothetical protein
MHKLSDGTLIFPPSTEGKSFMPVAESSQTEMTVEQMKARISLLSDEIDANEEENRFMQDEIDKLYAKIDAQKA